MAEITRKSMKNLNVSVGGLLISEGGGESDFVTVTSPQRFGSKTGVHGDAVFFDMPAVIYEVSINTIETSTVNADLQDLFNAQLVDQTQGPWDMQIEDVGTNEELSGLAMIVKEPDRTKTAEAGNYEWQLHLAVPDGAQYRPRG